MDKFFINGKAYSNVDKLSQSKLEHLLQLAEIQVTNYQVVIKNYPEIRMERSGLPHLKVLTDICTHIKKQIELKKSNA